MQKNKRKRPFVDRHGNRDEREKTPFRVIATRTILVEGRPHQVKIIESQYEHSERALRALDKSGV